MQYREKILELIFDTDDSKLPDWLSSFDGLDRLEVAKEIKLVLQQITKNKRVPKLRKQFLLLNKYLKRMENAYLNTQMASLQLEFAQRDLEKIYDAIDKDMVLIRDKTFEVINANPEKAAENMEILKLIKEYEIESDTYDPANWEGFEWI